MGSELESALSAYLTCARESLTRPKDGSTRPGNLIVLELEGQKLHNLAEAAESGEMFVKLVTATARAFCPASGSESSSTWKSAVQNFFRRSGFYQRIFAGDVVEDAAVREQYSNAFNQTEVKVTYLAPLEFVSFDERQMDFDDFQVRRFNRDELDQRLQQATCRIFYPWATIDTKLLSQYWFLSCSEPWEARKRGCMKVTLDIRVKPKYSGFPKPIEEALKRLVLFSWGTESHPLQSQTDLKALECWDAAVTFRVPFVLSASDSLTEPIFAAPSIAGLSTHPETGGATGEPFGEVPFVYTHVQKEPITPGQRTNQEFVDFVRWADTALNREGANYPFVDLAARFLVKGFFSEGLEQLLWHITAIEAALGENREGGLTKLLKSRVGLILGGNDEQRHGYAKLFAKLYDFRCDLVHGNEGLSENEANQRHLGQAREIARAVVVWMLHYLDHFRNTLPVGTATPKRADLLAALDAAPQNNPMVAELLRCLPSEFPRAHEWYD